MNAYSQVEQNGEKKVDCLCRKARKQISHTTCTYPARPNSWKLSLKIILRSLHTSIARVQPVLLTKSEHRTVILNSLVGLGNMTSRDQSKRIRMLNTTRFVRSGMQQAEIVHEDPSTPEGTLAHVVEFLWEFRDQVVLASSPNFLSTRHEISRVHEVPVGLSFFSRILGNSPNIWNGWKGEELNMTSISAIPRVPLFHHTKYQMLKNHSTQNSNLFIKCIKMRYITVIYSRAQEWLRIGTQNKQQIWIKWSCNSCFPPIFLILNQYGDRSSFNKKNSSCCRHLNTEECIVERQYPEFTIHPDG